MRHITIAISVVLMHLLLEITCVIPLKWYVFFTFVIAYVELDEALDILQQYLGT